MTVARGKPSTQKGQLVIGPQPGPQTDFLSCRADIALFGGSAGGGKSFALLLDPLRGIGDPHYTGVIFRREMPRITAPGGLKDEADDLWSHSSVECVTSPNITYRWPSGASIQMRHLQHAKDKDAWKGAQLSWIGFDELTEYDEEQFWYLISRARNAKSRHRPRVRATTNPDGASWVRKLLDWWIDPETGLVIPERSGIIRHFTRENDVVVWVDEDWRDEEGNPAQTFTFIRSSLEDNPALLASDPGYRQRLLNAGYVEGQRLLHGNWNVSHKDGMFKRARIADEGIYRHELPDGLRWMRYWDLANTEPHEGNPDPDHTAGALCALHIDEAGAQHLYIKDVARARLSGSDKHRWMRSVAEGDGRDTPQAIEQEGGSSGSEVASDYKTRHLAGWSVRMDRPTGSKQMRAARWLPLAEEGHVYLVRAEDGSRPAWFDVFLGEVGTFPNAKKDQVDAVSGAYALLSVPEKGISFGW